MTTPKDRLKPSPELVAQWSIESGEHEKALEYVCTKAAEWGAQQSGVVVPEQSLIDGMKEAAKIIDRYADKELGDEYLEGAVDCWRELTNQIKRREAAIAAAKENGNG